MDVRLSELRPVLSRYAERGDEVFDPPTPNRALAEASRHCRAVLSRDELRRPTPTDLERLFSAIATLEVDGRPFPTVHPPTSANWWEGLQTVVASEPDVADAFGALFDADQPLADRLETFESRLAPAVDEYGSQTRLPSSMSTGQLHGVSTTLLELYFPESYVAYRWKAMRDFFETYSTYEVKTAGSRPVPDQYTDLVEGFRTVLDALRDVVPGANMHDVHAVIYGMDELVAADPAVDGGTTGGDGPVRFSRDDVAALRPNGSGDGGSELVTEKFRTLADRLGARFARHEWMDAITWDEPSPGSPYLGPTHVDLADSAFLWLGIADEAMAAFGRPTKGLQMEFGLSPTDKAGFFGRDVLCGIYLNPRTGDSDLKAAVARRFAERSDQFAALLEDERYVLHVGDDALSAPSAEAIEACADDVGDGLLLTADVAIDELVAADDVTSLVADEFLTLLPYYGALAGVDTFERIEPPEADPTPDPEPELERPANADEFERHLETAKQVLFHGPPGTGKTAQARSFAYWWVAQHPDVDRPADHVEHVTFHPAYAYEDFVEGLTARTDDDTGQVSYEVTTGPLKALAREAQDAYDDTADGERPPPFVLLVDEINRGNVAELFGEAITLLEADKRAGQRNAMSATLPHSGESFTLPPNLYLIGTMNTADRSIALVDAALRRRFRFRLFSPDYDYLTDAYGFDSWDDVTVAAERADADPDVESLVARSILALRTLNGRIRRHLDRGQQIGHSYLLATGGETDRFESVDEVVDAWRFEILPLLEEYYFGQFERLQREAFDGVAVDLVDWDHDCIGRFDAETLASGLDQIR